MEKSNQYISFFKKSLIAFAVFTIGLLLLLLFHKAIQIFLILFASCLAGVFLLTLSRLLSKKTGISEKYTLWIVVLTIVIFIAGINYLVGAALIDQAGELASQLETSVITLKGQLENTAVGKNILSHLPQRDELFQGDKKQIISKAFSFFSSAFGIIGNFAIFIALTLFIASEPQMYVKGIVSLFPSSQKQKADDVLDTLSNTLFRWLTGRLIDMAILGIFTGLGLWILGIPLALTLGTLTFILCFIPNLGPFLALIPQLLIAFTLGMDKVIYVAILFAVTQGLESFILTPFIQKKAVKIPPVLLLVAQLLIASMTGILGLLLATPITATLMLLVKKLYVDSALKKIENND